MPQRRIGDPGEVEQDLHFPYGGVNVACPFERQPNVPVIDRYARTTPIGINVRGFDTTNRMRGGSRAGLARFINAQVSGETFIIQDLNVVVYVDSAAQI